jgi:hypothetical protein
MGKITAFPTTTTMTMSIIFWITIITTTTITLVLTFEPCMIPPNHYLTESSSYITDNILERNSPVYFGFTIPSSWNTKGNASIPTVLFRIEYSNVKCTSDDAEVQVQPTLKIGLNHPVLSDNSSTCSLVLRTVNNMTTWYKDVSNDIYIQYIAIYPSDIKKYANMVTDTNKAVEFAVTLEQNNCDRVIFVVKMLHQPDIDLRLKESKAILFPGLRQYYKYFIDSSVGENKLLLGSLQYQPASNPVTIHVKKDDYPSGGPDDEVFSLNTIAISPVHLYSVYYFYIEFEYTEKDLSDYVQTLIQTNLLVHKGLLCERGCGLGGLCNFTSGKCSCMHDQGYYGDDCSITGCIEGSNCTNGIGQGKLHCNGPDWREAVCVIHSCRNKILYAVDLNLNKCVQMFPVSVFAGIVSGSSLLSAIIAFLFGMLLWHFCYEKANRRHYHYLH